MLSRLLPDKFILILLGTIALATLLPAHGSGLKLASTLSNIAIFSLFFFHGLRLAHEAVWAGLKHWRLQLAVLAFTFGVIPLFGLSLNALMPDMLSPALWLGVFFLCVLPSTVQAAIASCSMAKGNVAASIWQTGTLEAIFERTVTIVTNQYTQAPSAIWAAHPPIVKLKKACGTPVSSKEPIKRN